MVAGSVVYLIILLVIAASVIRTIVLGTTLPPQLRQKDAPGVCGRCGYAFGMGHGEVCPECGTRYIEAGVLTRPLARKLRPSANYVLGSFGLVLLVTSGFVGSMSYALLETVITTTDTLVLVAVLIGLGFFVLSMVIAAIFVLRRRARIFAPNWEMTDKPRDPSNEGSIEAQSRIAPRRGD